ncbi:MAG: DUF4328 domain-containing protein [Capsulimonas sp.]|uniref:DUF4328 domain-containing protein n=1 Tax=Capsulimonas sp. TaxID=2494211 RepID=UPI00326670A0
MKTMQYSPPPGGSGDSVWPPPPTTPDIAPTLRPFVSLLPLARAVAALGVFDFIGALGIKLLHGHAIQSISAISSTLVAGLVLGLICVSYLAYRIIFLRWTFLAYRNLDSFEAAGLETTAAWAVGWFFVPVVNLYRPFMVFHELWKAGTPGVDSRDEVAWQRVPSSPLIGWWWSSVILHVFFLRMLDKVLTNGLTTVASTVLFLILAAVSVALSIAVVTTISRRQEAKAREQAQSFPTYL